ncbi:MAG: hypothetical protein K6T66_15800, partial [Peptococcaceae bacterium]|nr:hypothetical protein [Peptococcaceae bacterium]
RDCPVNTSLERTGRKVSGQEGWHRGRITSRPCYFMGRGVFYYVGSKLKRGIQNSGDRIQNGKTHRSIILGF